MALIKGPWRDRVKFVAVADASSKSEAWKEHANRTGGTQLRLSREAAVGLMEKYGFTGIPTLLIFGPDGKLERQYTSYPGNAVMQADLEEITK